MPGTIGACVVPARHLPCPKRPHTRPDCVRCRSHWKFSPTGERSCLFGHGAQQREPRQAPGTALDRTDPATWYQDRWEGPGDSEQGPGRGWRTVFSGEGSAWMS